MHTNASPYATMALIYMKYIILIKYYIDWTFIKVMWQRTSSSSTSPSAQPMCTARTLQVSIRLKGRKPHSPSSSLLTYFPSAKASPTCVASPLPLPLPYLTPHLAAHRLDIGVCIPTRCLPVPRLCLPASVPCLRLSCHHASDHC